MGPPRRVRASLVGAALAGAACGASLAGAACSASLDPIEVANGCPEQPLRGPTEWASTPANQLISDFESGNVQLAIVSGRDGSWIAGQDVDNNGDRRLDGNVSARCPARGKWAGHVVSGAGFSGWGANWTAIFRNKSEADAQAIAYNATERGYTAISFWAAAGDAVDEPFELPVGLTTLDVAWDGWVCDNTQGACMDYYRTTVSLQHRWQRYEIPFSKLKQIGKGYHTAMRVDQLVGFIVFPAAQRPFDIWLDDVRFER